MTLDEAIKHCEEVADYDCYNEKQLKCAEEHWQLAEWLRELKAYKESDWIPCSERLPEEETPVLVTRKFLGVKDTGGGWNDHIPEKTYVEIAEYVNGDWVSDSDEYKIARNRHTDPTAWKPLPEPWRGKQDEEQR